MANYETLKAINERSEAYTEILGCLHTIVNCLDDDYVGRKWKTTEPAPDLTDVYEQVKEVFDLFMKREAIQEKNTEFDVVLSMHTYQYILGKLLSANQAVERTNFDWNFDEDNDEDDECLCIIAGVGRRIEKVLNLML